MKPKYEVSWHDMQNGGQSQEFIRFSDAEQLYNDIWRKPSWYNANVYSKTERPTIKDLQTGKIIRDI